MINKEYFRFQQANGIEVDTKSLWEVRWERNKGTNNMWEVTRREDAISQTLEVNCREVWADEGVKLTMSNSSRGKYMITRKEV